MGLFEKLFGTRSQRELKKIQPTVDKILALEEPYRQLSEEALRGNHPRRHLSAAAAASGGCSHLPADGYVL